jgi:Fur family ferric uptake transcriptional regulator
MEHTKEAAIIKLRQRGYRVTPQRRMVLDALAESGEHISAEDIYTQVRAMHPRVNISTVYRTLELLKEMGLVTQTDLGEGRVRYHFGDKSRHHHLLCRRCGATAELKESLLAPLKEVLLREYGFKADLRHLAIFGYCAQCQH